MMPRYCFSIQPTAPKEGNTTHDFLILSDALILFDSTKTSQHATYLQFDDEYEETTPNISLTPKPHQHKS